MGVLATVIYNKYEEKINNFFGIKKPKIIEYINDFRFEEEYKSVINIYGNVQFNVEYYFLENDNGEYAPKHRRMKILKDTSNADARIFLKHADCAYNDFQKFLIPAARVGFKLYLSYKIAKKYKKDNLVQFIENGVKNNKNNIRSWLRCFEYLDYYGDFDGVFLPLSFLLVDENSNDLIRDNFTLLLESFKEEYSVDKSIPPKCYDFGSVQLVLIRVGNKKIWNYVTPVSKLKKNGANLFILCGRGEYINKIEVINLVLKKMFPKLISEEFCLDSFNSLEDKLKNKNPSQYKSIFLYEKEK
ncbi:MAG TPA: hypothetical protein HA367_00540 [Candidatus Methanofastidiosum sp.]|nr:hypothetical protein [Methanofastidiosum sp.]